MVATYYSVDRGEIKTYTGAFVIPEDGTYTVEYWSVGGRGLEPVTPCV